MALNKQNKSKASLKFEIHEKLVLKELSKAELISILEFINKIGNEKTSIG